MKFSLLIPTRRPHYLERLLNSFFRVMSNPKNFEILFAIDDEDKLNRDKVDELILKYNNKVEIKSCIRKRSIFLNEDYYNWLASKSSGDMLWVLGDDIEFLHKIKPIDLMLEEVINNWNQTHPDKVLCISVRDNTPPPSHTLPKFPCFPLFSRQAYESLGFLLHPRIPNWGADYVVYQTFKPINRLYELHDEVYLIHYSHHTKLVEPDDVAQRIGSIFNKMKMIPQHNIDKIIASELPNLRSKIGLYIEQNGGQK